MKKRVYWGCLSRFDGILCNRKNSPQKAPYYVGTAQDTTKPDGIRRLLPTPILLIGLGVFQSSKTTPRSLSATDITLSGRLQSRFGYKLQYLEFDRFVPTTGLRSEKISCILWRASLIPPADAKHRAV